MSRPQAAAGGFTLVEMMVVVTIGAVMAGLAAASVRDLSASRRVASEARVMLGELTDLRIQAVARGVPMGLCIRTQNYPKSATDPNEMPGIRTVFAKPTPAWTITPTLAAIEVASTDRSLQHRYSKLDGQGLALVVPGNPATLTLMFDSFGRATAWGGATCGATNKTPIAVPLDIAVTTILTGTETRTATLTLMAAGNVRYQR